MQLLTKSSSQAHESDDSHLKSLWVGNLSAGVTDSDLMSLFSKYGSVDSVTSYPSRNYAFVYFKRIEDAKAARQALQGAVLRGSSIKIDFSKPAKPCKSLWVSGISLSITKETLEEEFLKFGKIEEFKFIRDRNTAYVDYFRLEDAIQALKSMNGKRVGGDQIRVDFLRSHMSRREPLTNNRDASVGHFPGRSMGLPDSQWILQEAIRNYSEPTYLGLKQQHSQSSGGRRGDGQPSNVLWVGYPPSVHIDEQMLHNAMILFGEIERISSSPSRHYALVEFRSIDEARRAKEGLQGRLFNDPRISIMYASSELAPSSDHPGLHLGIKGQRPDVFLTELPFQPSAHMDVFNHNRLLPPNSLSGTAPSSGIVGPNMVMRPFGPQSSFEPLVSGPEFNDLKALNKLPDANPGSLMSGPNWRRSSPAPGRLPSPSLGVKQPIRPVSGAWDIFDANQLQRESKRSRIDTVLPVRDSTFPSKKIDDQSLGLDQRYGLGQQADECASAPLVSIQDKKCLSPAEVRIKSSGTVRGYLDHDYIWRGVIAKGGTPVCRARCVPIGKGIESDIPDVVNCSARTGLDMLTKHYADAIGFDIIFFLPDSEEDFASYTEFLHYLGAKNRAGVAKFEDGTTLFLVPPSDFLSKVLNVAGPERLYGVLLKFPQHAPSSSSMQPESFQSHNTDRQQMPYQNEHCFMSQKEEKVLQTEYSRVVSEGSLPSAKQLVPSTTGALPMQPTPSVNTAAASVAGVTLTPELIATLASLLPGAAKSSGSETAQPSLGSSSLRPSFPPSNELDSGLLPQGWTHNDQGPKLAGQPFHQVDNQFNPHGQLAQMQTCATSSNTSSNSPLGVLGNSQVQDPAFLLPHQGAVSSRPSSTVGIPSESVQLAVSAQINQQHNDEVPQSTQKGFGMAHGIDSHASYGSSNYQHTGNSALLSNLGYGTNGNQPHTGLLVDANKGNSELPNQVQQLQPALYGGSQGSLDVEADKNQRYQSTLQFAASLLFQMQQQKQQPSTKAGQGGC